MRDLFNDDLFDDDLFDDHLFDDHPFTAQERALLTAWDRHNALVANDEHDAGFEDRLIAAYQAAQEAVLRIAETDDAICRQIAADARAAGADAGAHGYAHIGPTYDRSLDAGFTEEKTLQQSDVGSR